VRTFAQVRVTGSGIERQPPQKRTLTSTFTVSVANAGAGALDVHCYDALLNEIDVNVRMLVDHM
jgi:hypothetical protein